MGKAAQSQLADKYSMKAMVAKHVELYRQIEPGMVEI
jgi:L-malate glycosyltransferase